MPVALPAGARAMKTTSARDDVREPGCWDGSPVALYRAVDGRFTDVNQAFLDCVGAATRESLLRTRPESLYVLPADRARRAEQLASAGGLRGFEGLMRRADGAHFPVRETSRAWDDADGRSVLEGAIEDASARAQSDARLRLSERRYRRLFETAKDGILLLDAESAEIVDVNPFLCELLGLSRDEVLGRKIWEIGPFRDTPASKVNFRTLQETTYIRYDDLPLESADGRTVAVEFVSNVYLVDERKVIQCNIRAIEERKHAEEALRRSERLNRNLVEHLPLRILVKDRRSVTLFCNMNYANDLGVTPAEVVGKDAFAFHPPEIAAAYHADDRDVMDHGTTKDVVEPYQVDGEERWVHTLKVPYRDERGEVIGVLVVFEDVTAGKLLERQLRQAQKLEGVGQLAAGIAHDFNNLLGIITGFGEMVHRKLREDDPLKGKVTQILKASEQAAGLTRQLLAFGRKQVRQPMVLDLNAVVSDMEVMLRRVLGEGVLLRTVLEPELGRVRADLGQIEQVLVNLAANARDATAGGGRVTIETRNVDVDVDYARAHAGAVPGPHVALMMTDTGAGMDAPTQARIFEPFFTTKEVGKGTGLGLSTVYGIVEQSGGHVWVYSAQGVGSTLKIHLPRVDEQATGRRPAKQGPLARADETVLLVEDEVALRELLEEALQGNGYEVIVARDGAEASRLAAAHEGVIDVMVTDVIMPGMTGPKAVELIARTRPAMKVLYISGYSDEAVVRQGLIGPGRAFINKPFGAEFLLRRVRDVLEAG
jgi:two-component system, cell cycle sensor histidine kinase and response regulator CckA